jgi:hypothetical protein
MQNMRHHVHARVGPTDKLAVMPDYVAYAWSGHLFRFAIFWEHILAPWKSVWERQRYDHLYNTDIYDIKKAKVWILAASGCAWVIRTRHNTVDS